MTVAVARKNVREEILELSVPLFAEAGFDGVSMRDIAQAVGVSPAALYHHFSDKDDLYLQMVEAVFTEKTTGLKALLAADGTPWDRLEAFVAEFTELLAVEKDFQRLLQWGLLDTNEGRTRRLADNVFQGVVRDLYGLAGAFSGCFDRHLLTVSIMSLILLPFEAGKASRYLPGYSSHHERPAVLARHVVGLLRHGLFGQAAGSCLKELPASPNVAGVKTEPGGCLV